ncbi:hypothetical protein FHN55_17200 [Streptomyces sp. NP160]|uniref:hypothetical protein n=1 Tax=Streptomyces sp. NP160 TaxID=2586637 RepID=UPI00111BB1E3|nr:hypothetical protein [Streptomyces sp. NP160]TNM61099.1 hypothetical protein FHN55_17200 [Streptomyces sp. NP160]
MTCETCGGRGFELVGVEPAGVVAMRCARCGRVERVVADLRPPTGGPQRPSRYLALHQPHPEALSGQAPAQVPAGARQR